MNKQYMRGLILSGFFLLASVASGCGGRPGDAGVSGYYQFPLIPIKVSYDVLNRKLQVSISGAIQTPIGTFGITASAGSASKQFASVRTLILETGTGKYVYQLERGKRYSISLPSDENGEAKIVYSGNDDNLSIVIPNPTTETVGELRRRLKEEQEARARAEAEARAAQEAEETGAEDADAEAEAQPAQEAETSRELERQAQEENYQRQLESERQRREAAELREQQLLQREQEAQRTAREAQQREQEAQQRRSEEMADRQRDEEAEQQRREERRRRRNEELIRLGINTAREVLRRH